MVYRYCFERTMACEAIQRPSIFARDGLGSSKPSLIEFILELERHFFLIDNSRRSFAACRSLKSTFTTFVERFWATIKICLRD